MSMQSHGPMDIRREIKALWHRVLDMERRTTEQGGGVVGREHTSSHSSGGDDEIDITDLGGFPGGSTDFLREDGTWATPGGLADGDKGDVTVSGSGATWTIDNDVVTYAKMQNVSAGSVLLGRGDSGAGDPQEITLGSGLSMSGTTLSAEGGGSPSGGGGGAFELFFSALANEPPASNPATPDLRNSHPVLDFDGATDEEAVFHAVLPDSYGGGGLTVDTFWAFTTATSGSLRVQAAIERIDASSLDIDADSFAAFQSAGGTAPGTNGQVIKVTITFADGSEMDSLAAGELFRLKIRRDADGTSGTDDIATDAELLFAVVLETT